MSRSSYLLTKSGSKREAKKQGKEIAMNLLLATPKRPSARRFPSCPFSPAFWSRPLTWEADAAHRQKGGLGPPEGNSHWSPLSCKLWQRVGYALGKRKKKQKRRQFHS